MLLQLPPLVQQVFNFDLQVALIFLIANQLVVVLLNLFQLMQQTLAPMLLRVDRLQDLVKYFDGLAGAYKPSLH